MPTEREHVTATGATGLRERLLGGWALDRASPVPVHAQIHARLTALIGTDVLGSGERVPSERVLAEWLGVSRVTARTALRGLAEDGLVIRGTGRAGTSVADPPLSHDLRRFRGFSDLVTRQGRVVTTRMVELGTAVATPAAAAHLALPPGDRVHRIRRLRLVDGEPATLEDSLVPERDFPDLLEHDLRGSIYALLARRYGRAPVRSIERITAVGATDEEAALLGLDPGAPLVRLDRVGFSADDRPVELSADLHRSDQIEFVVHGEPEAAP